MAIPKCLVQQLLSLPLANRAKELLAAPARAVPEQHTNKKAASTISCRMLLRTSAYPGFVTRIDVNLHSTS